MTTREDKEVAMALRLLDNAHKTLAMVDEAFIVKERGYEPRPMPTFRPEEISLGKILGTGGFGIVNEVSKFSLDEDHHDSCKDEPEDDQHKDDDEDLSPFFPPDTDVHYEITKARRLMEKRAVRNGICRYAIKRLHGDLTQLEKTRGMIDLAIEAKFLAVVWHPNISKCDQWSEVAPGLAKLTVTHSLCSQNARYGRGSIGRCWFLYHFRSSIRDTGPEDQ